MNSLLNISLILILAVISVSCETLTGSNSDKQQFFIENGYYESTGQNSEGEYMYNYEFTYYVADIPCEAGGYMANFDEKLVSMIPYSLHELEPGKHFKITNDIALESEIESPPEVSMGCVYVGSSEADERFQDTAYLQPK